ncbi:MAG: phosphodiesterase, partial [Calditrichaeota bacterium]|nr:phosphodiesterase [Calditrichota bacterium]
DWWAGEIDPPKAFAQLSPESHSAPKIVLSHNPDTKTHIQPFEWDLLLCGHTHGGQIRFPLIGAPFAPVRDKRFVEGLHRWENRWLHITRGIGNVRGIRINCRPEISHLSLIPTPNS